MIYSLYKIEWTEYERGWGQRPDGETFHLSLEEAEKFASDYEKKYNNEDVVPECYSKPGKPKLVEVSKNFYENFRKESKPDRKSQRNWFGK